ncbi:DUF6645 domain-containing protein [Escherichia coli]|uniref:DUF6645 domain-containing protein n=1 Tax=Escherichia coli TaxID=562 RepID=UPI00063D0E52|nr:DUF6645 domain-containing protein [Escherichia coli]KLH87739.1 hypothetical protein WR18_24765 [Escherichia coli]
MTFKHYDVVRAASPSDLADALAQKIREGWQPYGGPFSSYTDDGAALIQAIVAEGDVSTPVVVKPTGGEGTVISATSDPEYYFVVVLAGQSNGMSYGEGLPLPETYDRPDPRIKQLARRSTVTPGGVACKYNDIIPADHCLHDVQDMSRLNHPKAELSKGQYGTVGQGLHIAKKLLPFIPANAGILLVPCCRGGSAFTTGADGTYSDASGASENSTRWGVDKPLYKDLIGRTKAALKKNPKNVLFAVVWMQGEFDFGGTPANHAAQFGALVDKFRADLTDMAGQCVGGSAGGVPWICGDTTYFWASRRTNPDRLATAILRHAGRVALNAGVSSTVSEVRPSSPSGAEVTGVTTLLSYLASESEGSLKAQGWSASGGRAEVVSDAEGTGGKAVKLTKEAGKSTWVLEYAAGNGAALLQKGGQIRCRFKASGALAANQYVMAFYWPVSSLPQGVALTGDGGNNLLAAFYIQTDAKDLNVMYHNAKVATNNLKLGSFGAFDNEWHTLAFRFAGNNSLQVTPVLDGQDGTPFTLTQSPVSAFAADKLHVTDITKGATYPVLIDSITVEVNNADAAA